MTRAHLLRTTAIASGSVTAPQTEERRFLCHPPAITLCRPDGTLIDAFGFGSVQPGDRVVRLIDQTGKGLDAHA